MPELMLSPEEAIKLQISMARSVVRRDVIEQGKLNRICGVDVSYRGSHAFSCAVVLDRKTLHEVKSACIHSRVRSPYIPTLLFLREAPPVLEVLKRVEGSYDLLMVDAHGTLHPRMFGLACYIGLKVDRPTIGVGKSLLCGRIGERKGSEFVILDGKRVGQVLLGREGKPIYVSVGHKISLRTAVKIVCELTRFRVPEPLRLADLKARQMARGSS